MSDIAVTLVLWLMVGAFAACGLAWLAWWKIVRKLDTFMAGPPDAAKDMTDALAERRSGEPRHWTAGGK
jgi:hypothetical protein